MAGKMRTPLSRVRGLGSAKDGTDHWWKQRLTAMINLPLMLWLVISIVALSGHDYAQAVAWLKHPVAATLMVLALLNLFYHLRLGLQVVVEDYIHAEGTKVVLLTLLTLSCAGLALLASLSVVKVFLGS